METRTAATRNGSPSTGHPPAWATGFNTRFGPKERLANSEHSVARLMAEQRGRLHLLFLTHLSGETFLAIDRSGGSTNNNVYMVASVSPFGGNGTDVMFSRSTDGGVTFSPPHRINDDPINSNKWHWFGTIGVAPNGRIDSVWLDSRNAANNLDSQLFYSYSTDGGVTWAPNVAVSNSFNPLEGWPIQQKIGDYITIVSDNTGGDVAYSATFNFNPSRGQHEQDVYVVRVSARGGPTPSTTPR